MHENIKQAMVAGNETDTVHIFKTLRNTARVYKNAVAREVVELEAKGAQFSEIAHLVNGARGKRVYDEGNFTRRLYLMLSTSTDERSFIGDPEAGIWSASPVIGLIDDVPSCQELIDRMESDCEKIMLANAACIVPRSSKL
jgi:NAD(P)H-dependent flavin oxidoreductase YrpB (nitropropane dioxygenase family)